MGQSEAKPRVSLISHTLCGGWAIRAAAGGSEGACAGRVVGGKPPPGMEKLLDLVNAPFTEIPSYPESVPLVVEADI